jgi:hypothetical protein
MAKSVWERITAGQCNNNESLYVRRKVETARQFKDRVRAQAAAIEKKFDKLAALDKMATPEALKVKRAMSDRWDKRRSNNVAGFYNAKTARALKRAV